jgi:hypothetical protein
MGHGRNQVAPMGLIDRGPVDMLSACKEATFVACDMVCLRSETAGPSTMFDPKNAPNSAQDDGSCRDFNRAIDSRNVSAEKRRLRF